MNVEIRKWKPEDAKFLAKALSLVGEDSHFFKW